MIDLSEDKKHPEDKKNCLTDNIKHYRRMINAQNA